MGLLRNTIGSELDKTQGRGGGFDFLRVGLSLGVVTWHTFPLATGSLTPNHMHFFWAFDYSILIMFFGLSGFLISGSALRLSLKNFVINRSLRIVPALAVEIGLSALIIGPLLTTLPLKLYFTNFQTIHYFTNIVGWINYLLPGVFKDLPNHQVNLSLWTVPCEIGCYVLMSAFIAFGTLKKPKLVLSIALLWTGIGLAMLGYEHFALGIVSFNNPHMSKYLMVPHEIFVKRGSRLLIAFTIGICSYLYRYKLPYSWPLFWGCCIYYCVVASIGSDGYPQPLVTVALTVPLIYIMAFIGVTSLPQLPLFHRGDYSYGIYLYGWPIMQVMREVFPHTLKDPVLLWLTSVPLIILFAMFSWHAIEKPILRVRKAFSFIARERLAGTTPGAEPSHPDLNKPGLGIPAISKAP